MIRPFSFICDVSYDDTKAKFALWDREVTQLLGISVAQPRTNMISVLYPTSTSYPRYTLIQFLHFSFIHYVLLNISRLRSVTALSTPTIIDSIAEKTMVFKVKWQPR